MHRYLFTSDLRITQLPDRIGTVAQFVQNGHALSEIEDKSENNNATTLAAYYGLSPDMEICDRAARNPIEAIRNFILKFQFPNVRTKESLNDCIEDGTLLAPYRSIISLLCALDQQGEGPAFLTHNEILWFVFCDDRICKNPHTNYLNIASEIFNNRKLHVEYADVIEQNIQWKQYNRQSRELIEVLTFASECFVFKRNKLYFSSSGLEYARDKSFIESVVDYPYIWYPSNKDDFNQSTKEYFSYLDIMKTPFTVIDISNGKNNVKFDSEWPLQKIVYGAPGTGKSFGTDDIIKGRYPDEAEREKNVFRTTFHPDSDYSTFVGCYKPTKEKPMREDYSAVELKLLYKEFIKTCSSRPEHKFAGRYYASLEKLSKDEWKSVFEGSAESVIDAEINKAIAAAKSFDEATVEAKSTITYSFVPQAFTKAFCRAYELLEEQKPVFLVIEEINRGNCAQIFGDIFQLLDRDEMGWSKYEIKPDSDLDQYLQEHCPGYNSDKGMRLPPNLYIWATMNTSDQSLFPIDSAFKRRWEWKYVPIKNHPEEDYKIQADGKCYSWWDFIQAINSRIDTLTSSEDKKLGYFFVKSPIEKTIDENAIVSKVLFYLWNDVMKDYGLDNETVKSIFSKEDGKKCPFSEFFDEEGNADKKMVAQLMKNLKLEDLSSKEDGKKEDEEPEPKE